MSEHDRPETEPPDEPPPDFGALFERVTGVQEVVDEQESSSSRCIEGSPASESVVRVATDDGLEDTIDTFERETPD